MSRMVLTCGPADVKMTLQDTTQTVTVSTDTVQLSVDPESNQSATVITGDALNALSDDPDELQAELTALAASPSVVPKPKARFISMVSLAANFHLSPPSWQFASTRTHSRPSTTGQDTGASRS